MMFIETWILAIIMACIGILGILASLNAMIEGKKLEESQKENARLRDEVRSRDIIIERLNGKILIKTATEYYEGKKK